MGKRRLKVRSASAGAALLCVTVACVASPPQTPANVGTPRAQTRASAGHPDRLFCSIDLGAPVACSMTDHVNGRLEHSMRFTLGHKSITFTGKSQTGWWSGTLNGRPAMGYELNRGHTVYSTRDLKTRFEWWYAGMRHGNY